MEVPFRPDTCGSIGPPVLHANRLALRVYQSAYWQFSSNGMGDATFPGTYAQSMLQDLGCIGPERVEVMERIRILDEQRRLTDIGDDGESIRGKRQKKPATE